MATSKSMTSTARRLFCGSYAINPPPAFLLPCLATVNVQQTSLFSSTTHSSYPRDNNRERGVSTTRRTGPRQPSSVSKVPLPQPVLDPSKRSKLEVDPNHGLWSFFHSKVKPMNTPEEDEQHGRAWAVEELRGKSWQDLHALWYTCCKERNRIATESYERERLDAGYGDVESKARDRAVRMTQRGIKHVLTERFYAWNEAHDMADQSPEFDLSGRGQVYTPAEDNVENIDELQMTELGTTSLPHDMKSERGATPNAPGI